MKNNKELEDLEMLEESEKIDNTIQNKKEKSSKKEKRSKKRHITHSDVKSSVFFGSLILIIISIWLLIETYSYTEAFKTALIISITTIAYSVFQLLWVFLRKRLTRFEKIFFSAVNFIPALLEYFLV